MNAMIRPARLTDGPALQRNCYPDEMVADVSDYLAWCLRQTDKGWIVRLIAEVDAEAVGNVQLTVCGAVGEIGSLVVAPAYRGHGLSRWLLAEVIWAGREHGLAALEIDFAGDRPALGEFYARMGFKKKKELPLDPSARPLIRLRMDL
ncbi:MAG TPA: GNAT family N-acetyltransferase [Anaerolineae bacterium]|nr:GNAT family N-acetyltransferase [Anaerolineae bacterium]